MLNEDLRRTVIGSSRLRLDANEAWDALTARRMIQALSEHQIEFIEQPTRSDSIFALAQLRKTSPIAIAADQLVFTPEDFFVKSRQFTAIGADDSWQDRSQRSSRSQRGLGDRG